MKGLAGTFGLGFWTQAWSCCRRCSASRIEVSSRSRRSRSAGPSVPASDSRLLAHAVEDALAGLDALDLAGHFLRRAVDEQLLEDLGGPSFGRHLHALAIPRQTPQVTPPPSDRDGNRVAPPRREATS